MYIIELFWLILAIWVTYVTKHQCLYQTVIDYCTVKGPKYITDIFLCRPLKMTTQLDDTFLLDKTFAQTCWYPDEILQSLQSCREVALSEFCKHTSKTGNLSHIKLKRFARLLQVSQHFEYVIRYQVYII